MRSAGPEGRWNLRRCPAGDQPASRGRMPATGRRLGSACGPSAARRPRNSAASRERRGPKARGALTGRGPAAGAACRVAGRVRTVGRGWRPAGIVLGRTRPLRGGDRPGLPAECDVTAFTEGPADDLRGILPVERDPARAEPLDLGDERRQVEVLAATEAPTLSSWTANSLPPMGAKPRATYLVSPRRK